MKSTLFFTDAYKDTEAKIKDFLNAQKEFLSGSTVKSTRAAGDAIQDILSTHFPELIGEANCKNYKSDFTRRAMLDLAFEDKDSFYYGVDVKSHRTSTKFNRPNLTSVKRLAEFYKDDRKYFVIVFVGYDVQGLRVVVSDVKFIPIEFLDWKCLALGNLGNCQIQIAKADRVIVSPQNPRKAWMLELCDRLSKFYPREISKITDRIEYFKKIREFWEKKTE